MPEPPNKGKTYPATTLDAEQIRALIYAEQGQSARAIMNRALLLVTWRGALRVSEVLNLVPANYMGEDRLQILNGKGGKSRLVGLDHEARGALEAWLAKRKELGLNGKSYLFCTKEGKQLHPNHVRNVMRRLAKREGVEARVFPHLLRHSRAAELARQGKPVNLIQKALGHSSLATTSRYLDHVAAQDVIAAMKD